MFGLTRRRKEVVPQSQEEVSVKKGTVVVFGSRMSGAYDLEEGLKKHLEEKGVHDIDVQAVRNAANIRKCFPGQPDSFINEPPMGVVLLPEMRQYVNVGGCDSGMSLQTFECGVSDTVERLCEEHGVPLVEIGRDDSDIVVAEKIKKLTSGK